MNLLLQYIFLFILFILILQGFKSQENIPADSQKKSNGVFKFVQFIFITSLIYLAAISEMKYFLYVLGGIGVVLYNRLAIPFGNRTFFALYIFIIWILGGTIVSPYPSRGFLMVIKYGILLLCIILGFGIDDSKQRIADMFHRVMIAMLIFSLLGGGIAWVFYPQLYISIWNFILTYAGMADCFSAVIPIGIFLFFITKKTFYLILCFFLFLSSILEAVRTGIGGIGIAIASYLIFQHRSKNIFLLGLFAIMIIGVVLYVRPVRDKMFRPDMLQRLAMEGPGWYLLNQEAVNDNGRHGLKEFVHVALSQDGEHFWCGVGTGGCSGTLKLAHAEQVSTITLLHNDHYVIYLDNGVIGVGLWWLWILTFVSEVISYVRKASATAFTKNLGYCAVSSLLAMNFAMFFDNVISHSLSSIGLSCLLIGIFLRQVEKERKENTMVIP